MNTTNPGTAAPPMKRDDYKAVKHMNKGQMTEYLHRIYLRGFEAGLAAAGYTAPEEDEDKRSQA